MFYLSENRITVEKVKLLSIYGNNKLFEFQKSINFWISKIRYFLNFKNPFLFEFGKSINFWISKIRYFWRFTTSMNPETKSLLSKLNDLWTSSSNCKECHCHYYNFFIPYQICTSWAVMPIKRMEKKYKNDSLFSATKLQRGNLKMTSIANKTFRLSHILSKMSHNSSSLSIL